MSRALAPRATAWIAACLSRGAASAGAASGPLPAPPPALPAIGAPPSRSSRPRRWNFTPSPGWTKEELHILKLCLMRFGVGQWLQILNTGLLPGKLIQQLNGQTQRLLGQQSLAAYSGLKVDIDRIRADNEQRADVLRKGGLIIYQGPTPNREAKQQWQREAKDKCAAADQLLPRRCAAPLRCAGAELRRPAEPLSRPPDGPAPCPARPARRYGLSEAQLHEVEVQMEELQAGMVTHVGGEGMHTRTAQLPPVSVMGARRGRPPVPQLKRAAALRRPSLPCGPLRS